MLTKIKNMFQSDKYNKIASNTCAILFLLLSTIALALDVTKPFNYINIGIAGLIFIITMLTIFFNNFSKKHIINYLFAFLMIGLIFIFLLSWLFNLSNGFPKTVILVTVLSLCLFLWFIYDKKNIKKYLFAFLIATWLFAPIFIIFDHSIVFHPSMVERPYFVIGNLNDVAKHLVICLLTNIFAISYFQKNKISLICGVVIILDIYFLFLTKSISNLFLLFIVIIISFAMMTKGRKRYVGLLLLLLFFAIVILCILFIPSLSYFKNRIIGIFESLFNKEESFTGIRADASARDRLNVFIDSLSYFAESPLFGNGYNSVPKEFTLMAHNNVGEIAADHGVFALLFEEVLIIFPIYNMDKIKEKNKLSLSLIIYICLVQISLVSFNQKVESIVLALIYAYLEIENEGFSIIDIKEFFGLKSYELQEKPIVNDEILDVSKYKVSIICPLHNDEKFLKESIESVLNQTHQNFEMIIIDDYSTDNSLKIVKEYKDSRIKLICNDKNYGAAKSRNVGLANSTGDFVAFLDCDDVWWKSKLEKQLKFMVSNGYNFSATKYCEIDENSNLRGISVRAPSKMTHRMFRRIDFVGCLTVMVKKEYVDNVFVPETITKRNDYALWLMISRKTPCYFLDENLAYYRRHSSGNSLSTSSKYSLFKSMIFMFREVLCVGKIRSLIMGIRFLLYYFIKKLFYVKKDNTNMKVEVISL